MSAPAPLGQVRGRTLLRELLLALLPLLVTVALLIFVTQPAYDALINGNGVGHKPFAYQGLVQDLLLYQADRLDPARTPDERRDSRLRALSSARNREQFMLLSELESQGEGRLSTIERGLEVNTDDSVREAVRAAQALSLLAETYTTAQGWAYQRAIREMRVALIISAVCAGLLSLGLILRALMLWRAERVRLEKREERQREALSLASHEMRRPLQALLLASDLLRQAGTEAQRQALLSQIEESAADLASRADLTRLNDLYLDISLNLHVTDLTALVTRFQSGRVQVTVPAAAVPWSVDAHRVRQILENLVENALKYTSGPVEVTLDTPQGRPRVQVRDFGPGMSDELLRRVFLPFERGPQQLTPGQGLGLPLVQRYARAHGGDVSIAPAPGGGLTVTLTLGDVPA